MIDWQQRTEQLFGPEKTGRLRCAHVLVVGVGGVGAYAAEMLCRAGIGEMTIVDADTVQPSNINRQLPATHDTVGRLKTDVMQERLLAINPALVLHALPIYLTDDNIPALLDGDYQSLVPDSPIPNSSFLIPNSAISFIVDAIDTIAPKCALIIEAHLRRIPIISSMGAGAKSDITKVQFARLEDTYHCGLSKAVRTRLRNLMKSTSQQVNKSTGVDVDDIKHIDSLTCRLVDPLTHRPVDSLTCRLVDLLKTPVVFSSEKADPKAIITVEGERNKKSTTGTVSYMPAVFGCYLADYVIERL